MEAYYNNHSPWLSAADALRGAAHDQQPSSTSTGTPNGAEWSKPGDIDLSDFGLGDLQASNASPTSTASMQHLYQFPGGAGYFTTMPPFNMIPFGQPPPTWPQQNLPLSSYSTLNGATSSIGAGQSQQQQQPHQQPGQPQATQQSATIDPSLTSTTSSTSYSPPPSASSQNSQHSPSLQFSVPFHQQQQHPHQNMHSPVLALPPVYLMQQQPQQQQRTLNPQQLTMQYPFSMYSIQQHTQSPMQTNLTATTSQSTATPPLASNSNPLNSTKASQSTSAPVPELDPEVFKQTVDRLLSPSGLSDSRTVGKLMDAIAEMSSARVTPEMRTDIACRIRDNAGNAFFAAWARNAEAMVLIVSWLKAGVTGKDEGKWECTIMPLLHVLDRLPLTVNLLREHRLGKLTTALLKSESVSPAIKDMASNISNKWRNLVETSSSGSPKEKDPTSSKKLPEIEDKTKKRKLGDTAPKPPSKVAVVSTGNGAANGKQAVKVKKEKVVVTAVKDAKADASFFSAPKPKPKLPSFKKAPAASVTSTANAAPTGTSSTSDISQPNDDNPFQQALKDMKGRAAAAAVPANKLDGVNGDIAKPSTPDLIKNGKKRKSVSWAPEGHLEKVRIIERALYDDDPVNGMHGAHSIRDLERAEGAAMHLHLFEEVIDWYEPNNLELPRDTRWEDRGSQSEEKVTQEEREKITLGALYFADSDIPESPGEPATQIPIDQVDSEARTMMAGEEIEPFFQQAMSVSDLIGQLSANTSSVAAADPYGSGVDFGSANSVLPAEDVSMSNVNNAFGVSGGFDLSKLDPNALSSLAASLGLTGFNFGGIGTGAGTGAAPDNIINNSYPTGASQNAGTVASASAASSAWGVYNQHQQPQSSTSSLYPESGYGYDERDRDDRIGGSGGRGGYRGRGRGGFGGFRGGRGGGPGGGGFAGSDFKYKKRCNFFASGSCRYGDQCHFLHELD